MNQAPVFPLVANNDVIVAIVQEFRAMYRLLVPEIPFALCLHDVLGYVQSDFAIDDSSSLVVELVGAVHNTDFVAEKLPIRPINFPFPEFQAARRVKHLTLVVAGYPLVTLTGMSAD